MITDLACKFAQYDEGTLTHDEYIELMQYLVDTGMAWTLQGSIGRECAHLLEAGELTIPEYMR